MRESSISLKYDEFSIMICMHREYRVLISALKLWESKSAESNVTSCFALPCSQSSSSTWMHIKELRCVLPIWTAGRTATRLDDFISVQSTQRPVYRRELPLQFALCNVFLASYHIHRSCGRCQGTLSMINRLWKQTKVSLSAPSRETNGATRYKSRNYFEQLVFEGVIKIGL